MDFPCIHLTPLPDDFPLGELKESLVPVFRGKRKETETYGDLVEYMQRISDAIYGM